MKNGENVILEFAKKEKCSLNEAKKQIKLLIKETTQTNLGINNTIDKNGYIRFPNDLSIFN